MLVKIPLVKAKLKVYSKDIEKINILTKIILHSVAVGININEIKNIINLPHKLVIENIEELEKRGIIIGDYEGNYRLTDVGLQNFNLLKEIEEINKEEKEVFVDNYTKYIFTKEDIKNCYIEENQEINDEKIIEVEKNKYMKQFLNNLDPSNSKELVLNMLKNITEQDKENISVEVKMVNKDGGYMIGKVKENIIKRNEKSKMGSEVIIKREIFKNTYIPVFNSLKKIDKKSLEALITLKNKNKDFISDEGLNILEKNLISKKNYIFYYDPKNKKVSLEKIKSEIKENEIKSKLVLNINTLENNIDIIELEEINMLKTKYENDIYFEVKTEKEYIYEKFAIEDVIDIYEEV